LGKADTRIWSIDHFRGFAIIMMILANYMNPIKAIPSWLKHAPDIGLTFIDLIAPFFIFAIGLTLGLSFKHHCERDGLKTTVSHFVKRWFSLIGIGAIITAGEFQFGISKSIVPWGVLQAIGFSGLVVMGFVLRKTWIRFVVGTGILIAYQILLNKFWLKEVLGSNHGGLLGAFSWAGMLMLSTVIADLFHDKKLKYSLYLIFSIFTLTIGVCLHIFSPVYFPISKNRVSISYDLVSLGIAALIFFLFHIVNDIAKIKSGFLTSFGKNPLLLYIAHYFLLAIFYLPNIPLWYKDTTLWLASLQMAFLISILWLLAWWLDKKKIVVAL